jgi:four helix bundle protein
MKEMANMKTSPKEREIQKKGYGLAKSVFEVTKNLPAKEMKEFASQMRNTAMFVPFNIAEAVMRKTKKQASLYLIVAKGFLNKLDTDVERSRILGIIDSRNYHLLETQIKSINSLLAGLLRNRKN